MKALCIVPFGMEEGIEGQEFSMIVGEAVEFRSLSSTIRKDDPQGQLLNRYSDEEIEELAPIQTTMEVETNDPGVPIPVRLHARVTELGTFDLDLRARDGQSWKLEYEIRDPSS